MEITVHNTEADKTILTKADITWKKHTSNFVLVWIVLGLGIVFFSIGIYLRLHALWAVGLGFTLAALFYLNGLWKSKRSFFEKVQKQVERRKVSNEYMLHFTSESVKYQDVELTMEMKWTMFTWYKEYADYLILGMYDNETTILVSKKFISENEFGELLSFVQRLMHKSA